MGRQIIDLTGQVFNRLTAIERVKSDKHGHARWLCECMCGNKIVVSAQHLKCGGTQSCGCLYKERVSKPILPYGEASFNMLYGRYKRGAKKRNFEWNLDKKQFKILTKDNCHYCGIEPKQIDRGNGSNSEYIYNGIDRVDNDKGYTIDNCVSCCKMCNGMKEKLMQKEFINHINKIYKYNEDKHYDRLVS